jgi:hypothetical protein
MYKYERKARISKVIFTLWIVFLLGVAGFYAYEEYNNYKARKRVEALIKADREQRAREVWAAKIRAANKRNASTSNCMERTGQEEKSKEPTRQEILKAITAHINPPAHPTVKLNDSTSITVYLKQ